MCTAVLLCHRRYRLLEIELDAVYRSMLLLKKKKYAAVKVRQAPQRPPPPTAAARLPCIRHTGFFEAPRWQDKDDSSPQCNQGTATPKTPLIPCC